MDTRSEHDESRPRKKRSVQGEIRDGRKKRFLNVLPFEDSMK
jgi:hypothetical protein